MNKIFQNSFNGQCFGVLVYYILFLKLNPGKNSEGMLSNYVVNILKLFSMRPYFEKKWYSRIVCLFLKCYPAYNLYFVRLNFGIFGEKLTWFDCHPVPIVKIHCKIKESWKANLGLH